MPPNPRQDELDINAGRFSSNLSLSKNAYHLQAFFDMLEKGEGNVIFT